MEDKKNELKLKEIISLITDDCTDTDQAIKLIDLLFLQKGAVDYCYYLIDRNSGWCKIGKSEKVGKYFLSKYYVLYKQELDKKINCVLYGDSQSKES